jgi:transcriptional regulator CtsR
MTARRRSNPNSESVDNYLKAILALSGPEENKVTSNTLARRLDVAPSSVTNSPQARLHSSSMSGIVACFYLRWERGERWK